MIFIDEIDTLCPSRNHSTPEQNRITSTLLTLLDGTHITYDNDYTNYEKVFILAATNHPESLDPAFRRPGRLD